MSLEHLDEPTYSSRLANLWQRLQLTYPSEISWFFRGEFEIDGVPQALSLEAHILNTDPQELRGPLIGIMTVTRRSDGETIVAINDNNVCAARPDDENFRRQFELLESIITQIAPMPNP